MASGKFSYFRHSVNARNDDKLKDFSHQLGRKSKEAYFYFFTLLELCASESDEGQTEFKIHNATLRTLWESNAKGVQSLCKVLANSTLLMCKPYANHVVFSIPNLPTYLGLYDVKKRKEKERKEEESITIIQGPLSFLFHARPDIQKWLNEGNHDTQKAILAKNKSHHELAELIEKAFTWAQDKNQRAEAWLMTFITNSKTSGFGSNQAQKSKTPITPDNLTGNPYKAKLAQIRSEGKLA